MLVDECFELLLGMWMGLGKDEAAYLAGSLFCTMLL